MKLGVIFPQTEIGAIRLRYDLRRPSRTSG
jgi:hypothetical protein